MPRKDEEKKPKESELVKEVKQEEKKLEEEIEKKEGEQKFPAKNIRPDKKAKKDELSDEDRELLKEAEEREKKRKEQEELAKTEAKEIEKEEKAEQHEKKVERKAEVRVKPRHGKNYRKLAEQIEKDKEYPISEAIELAIKTSPAKFDATVEMHVKINVKEKNIRGMVTMHGGIVKEKKIQEVNEKNVDDVIANIKAGKMDFDILIADLKVMPKMAILAKILGPKGLMPSPKTGTAVEDVAKAVEELKGGRVEYRTDKNNVVHMPIGKISFGSERIYQNYEALIHVLPIKKVDSIYLTTTMGPSVKVNKK